MGAWINFSNRIEISTHNSGLLPHTDYKELTPEFITKVISNDKIKYIQISKNLPKEVFLQIDSILAQRPDITFRIYGIGHLEDDFFDLNVLKTMPHLINLQLEAHLVSNPNVLNCEVLCELSSLRSLTLNLFDMKDYSFIKELPESLEKLQILADCMKGSVVFDCKWLLNFPNLNTLYLGQKAKKNITEIAKLTKLKHLSLRGIKLPDFYFLKDLELESLSILWCGMNDLTSLEGFISLKSLELWRIMNLKDISFISSLINLEILKLQDLRHIIELPDLSKLSKLKKIVLDNTSVDEGKIPTELQSLVHYH